MHHSENLDAARKKRTQQPNKMTSVNKPSTAYIGLGSNLDNPHVQIDSAVKTLRQAKYINTLSCSYYYRSKAVGPGAQPDYVNAAIKCETSLSPIELLAKLQCIENAHGRQRDIRWGARTLDLDLLLYDDICIDEPTLQVPHPEIRNRNFVLCPLQDINPDLVFPDGEKIERVMQSISMDGLHRIDSTHTQKQQHKEH
jgi:2-amino-4-hydroxy-6-hydroxymethyldihydropteridine diphosphokinase